MNRLEYKNLNKYASMDADDDFEMISHLTNRNISFSLDSSIFLRPSGCAGLGLNHISSSFSGPSNSAGCMVGHSEAVARVDMTSKLISFVSEISLPEVVGRVVVFEVGSPDWFENNNSTMVNQSENVAAEMDQLDESLLLQLRAAVAILSFELPLHHTQRVPHLSNTP